MCDDGGSSWRFRTEISKDVVSQHPVRAVRVENRQKSNKVGILANTPLVVVVFREKNWWRWAFRRWQFVCLHFVTETTPDTRSPFFGHELSEVSVVFAMNSRDIEAFATLPETATGLFAAKGCNCFCKFVHVASVAGIDLPVPYKVEFGVLQNEMLNRKPLRLVDTLKVSFYTFLPECRRLT